jgi:hypothetical protein
MTAICDLFGMVQDPTRDLPQKPVTEDICSVRRKQIAEGPERAVKGAAGVGPRIETEVDIVVQRCRSRERRISQERDRSPATERARRIYSPGRCSRYIPRDSTLQIVVHNRKEGNELKVYDKALNILGLFRNVTTWAIVYLFIKIHRLHSYKVLVQSQIIICARTS